MPIFSSPVRDLIRRRSSWRRYLGQPLEPGARAKLQACLQTLPGAPFPGKVRFELLDIFPEGSAEPRRLGTYGNIAGAVAFVAGAAERAPYDLENYAYLMEMVILAATDLELGTCWLGGAFDRGAFAAALNLSAHERVPAVTPVGAVPEARSFRDRFIRAQAGSAQRKPWNELFFLSRPGQELEASAAGNYAEVLEMVRLGPSASNRQPWRIVKQGSEPLFHFYLQRNPVYTRVAKTFAQADDIQRLDMGIALCHFELTARELKLKGQWRVLDQPSLFPKMEYLATWVGA